MRESRGMKTHLWKTSNTKSEQYRSVYSRVTISSVPEFLNPAAEGGI
jgi:hypothetical protein